MTRDRDPDPSPTEAPFDALLHERLGGESPPDLTGTIETRFGEDAGATAAAKLAAADAGRAPAGNRHLLAAAFVLLGTGVVAGSLWLARHDDSATGAAPLQQPVEQLVQEPQGQGQGEAKAEAKAKGQEPEPAKAKVAKPVDLNNLNRADPRLQAALLQQLRAAVPDETGDLEFALRVVDGHGGPIQDFELSILGLLSKQPLRCRRLQGLDVRRLQPRDFAADFVTIGKLPAGEFILAVRAAAHARTLSEPFTVAAGEAPPQLTVKLNKGGEIRGVVVDGGGRPVAGAAVRSQAASDGPAPNSPFTEMLLQLQPKLHTEITVRTDADGRFHFRGLTYGRYAVHVEHPDYCGHTAPNLQVSEQAVDADRVALEPGARIRGVVIDQRGQPLEGVRVTMQRPGPAGAGAAGSWSTLSDVDGAFEFSFRLPPGSYKIFGLDEAGNVENPFQKLLQIQESTQSIVIEKGQGEVQQDLTLIKD